jgi:hypothetical protein
MDDSLETEAFVVGTGLPLVLSAFGACQGLRVFSFKFFSKRRDAASTVDHHSRRKAAGRRFYVLSGSDADFWQFGKRLAPQVEHSASVRFRSLIFFGKWLKFLWREYAAQGFTHCNKINRSVDEHGDASMEAASINQFSRFAVAIAAAFCLGSAKADEPRPCTGACIKSDAKTACCQEACGKKETDLAKTPCGDCNVSCLGGHCASSAVATTATPSDATTATGLAAFVSDWLAQSPKFSAQLAIHFGPTPTPANKLGSGVPTVAVAMGETCSDRGVTGCLHTEAQTVISRPMKFAQNLSATQIGELVSDVIACGHRICAGNKCYEVKDEPVAGTHCDSHSDNSTVTVEADAEEIQVVPMAPPAPPGQDIAAFVPTVDETEVSAILRSSGLQHVKVSVPVATVVDLLVAKTELSTRLEMAELLLNERQTAHEQYLALADRNSKLATQLAVAEARQHYSDAITASLMDRTELAIKMASQETRMHATASDVKTEPSSQTVRAIQEDLSNIRRQIALMRRSQPVPFAPSYVGIPSRPYVPTAQLLTPSVDVQTANPAVTEPECGTDTSPVSVP